MVVRRDVGADRHPPLEAQAGRLFSRGWRPALDQPGRIPQVLGLDVTDVLTTRIEDIMPGNVLGVIANPLDRLQGQEGLREIPGLFRIPGLPV